MAGGEAGTSELHSRHRKGYMINIYLTDTDEEATVVFVKDHEELYDKTNEHFRDRDRKECLWKRFPKRLKLAVKVCKTRFASQRTHYEKLTQAKSGHPKQND